MATNNVLDLLDLMLDNGEDSRDNNTPSVAHCDSVYFTSKADRYENISARITDGEESVRACVLSTGNKFRYVIPGFDPIGVRLCPVKVSLRIEDSVEIYDFFMKDDKSLCRSFPSEIVIKDITVVKVLKIALVVSHIANYNTLHDTLNCTVHEVTLLQTGYTYFFA